jgi:S-formylglutathione hydrolase FrmB
MNSILWGNYEDFMTTDLIAWVGSSFRTIPERNGRALMGQSMGAYGSFRYGILHKDKYRALAAHAGVVNSSDSTFQDSLMKNVIKENQPGPPYFFDFENSGFWTKAFFSGAGAYAPNLNTPQNHINPQIVEFAFDEHGITVDTIAAKYFAQNIAQFIHHLSPEDEVGIFFGCGSNDRLDLYPMNIAFKNTLDSLGLPYEFFDHDGDHGMPPGFKQQALIFLDSLMVHPAKYPGRE